MASRWFTSVRNYLSFSVVCKHSFSEISLDFIRLTLKLVNDVLRDKHRQIINDLILSVARHILLNIVLNTFQIILMTRSDILYLCQFCLIRRLKVCKFGSIDFAFLKVLQGLQDITLHCIYMNEFLFELIDFFFILFKFYIQCSFLLLTLN